MKIKFSKTLAIACILCMTFATLTAFAAPTVTTITSYDYEAAQKAAADKTACPVTVETTISGLADNGEITYYVEKNGTIVYIDQVTAASNAAKFTFEADVTDVITATAKNGSDKNYSFPTFKFVESVNFQTNGTATANAVKDNWAKKVADAGLVLEDGETALAGGYVFQGQISGQVEKEYGVQIVIGTNTYRFPARGCDANGVYVVVIDGFDDTDATVKAAIAAATPYIAE